jgi:chromatin segregation and condensation protein Rec8/ScpA/Scc1 (kleisin family)
MNGKPPWENLPDIEIQKIAPYYPAQVTHQAAERSSAFAIEDLLVYLSTLEPNEQFSIEEVVKRIDRIDWGQDDLLNAGDVFLKTAKLWRLKWSLLLCEGDVREEQPTTEEIWEVLVDLSRKTTDYTRIEALYEAPEPLVFPRIKRQSPRNIVKYKEISTLENIESLAHKETPQEDAVALIEYLKNETIALNLVAENLFEGNQVRAFIAALFAGTKIKMHQDEFYGNIRLAAIQFLSDTSSHNS